MRAFLEKNVPNVQVLECDYVEERDRLFASDDIVADGSERDELRRFLEAKMRPAFAPKVGRAKDRWDEETLRTRLLGYGNEAHLLVLSYNVPTVPDPRRRVAGDSVTSSASSRPCRLARDLPAMRRAFRRRALAWRPRILRCERGRCSRRSRRRSVFHHASDPIETGTRATNRILSLLSCRAGRAAGSPWQVRILRDAPTLSLTSSIAFGP